MVIQTHLHGNAGFPFCVNGFCSGGLECCFSKQQQKQHQQRPEQPPRHVYNERQGHADPNLHVGGSNTLDFPNLAFQFEKQWEEIDQHIKSQNEQLKLMIQQQEKQQVTTVLKNAESRTLHILMKKDEEIAQAVQKKQELEEFIKRLEAENREWKKVAREKEATILALYKTLEEEEEKKERIVANDVQSCCGENENKKEEQATWENRLRCGVVGEFDSKEVCKGCYSHRSCYLFLPCRHLVSCKVCEAYLQACPICGMLKKASIETLFF